MIIAKEVYRWQNGLIMVFDKEGKQIPYLQGPWTQKLEDLIRQQHSDEDTRFHGFPPDEGCISRRGPSVTESIASEAIGEANFTLNGEDCLMVLVCSFDMGHTVFGWVPQWRKFAVVHLHYGDVTFI